MDNDIFIPYKFRASQIVGLTKIAVKAIEAEGMRLREGSNSSGIVNKIGWFNELAGIYKEFITGVTNTVSKTHTLLLQAGNGPSKAEGELWSTILQLVGSDVEPSKNTMGAFLNIAYRTTKSYIGTTIMDESMQSSFLQLSRGKVGFGAQLELEWGVSSVNYFEGQGISSNTTVNHSLGRVPQGVFAISRAAPNEFFVGAPNVFAETSTQFTINFKRPGTLGTSAVGFFWIAIG